MKYYTCSEIAKKFGLTRQAVIYHAKKGTFTTFKSTEGVYLIPENAKFPPAWEHGEKGRVANARYGAINEFR